jgi:hypothetical protein
MKKTLILLPLLCCIFQANAQLVTLGNSLRVIEEGDTLLAAWAGGVNVPQFCAMDLENDGVMDLLAFERNDDQLIPLHHVSGDQYRLALEYRSLFPTHLLADWIFTADYDGDGFLDLFTGFQSSTVRVLRNTSASTGGTLSFAQVKFPLLTDYYPPGGSLTGLYAARNDYSAFADVDGDTDLDVLVFDGAGSYVNWHRNTSIENGWGRDSLTFVQQSACFGHFKEDISGCTATLDVPPCVTGIVANPWEAAASKNQVHAGSTLLAWDLNDDSLMDLIVGDASCDHLYALTNGGTPDTAHFVGLEVNFPVADTPVSIYSFPAAFAVDVDHDGARDMIAAPNISSTGEDIHSVWLYHNAGADKMPDLRFVQDDFVQDQMMEMGTGALPGFIDFDQDGDEDLVVGCFKRFVSTAESYSRLSLYLNEGTATDPVLRLHSRDWLGLSASKWGALSPCAGDLDGDGDDDLLLGTEDGALLFLRNDALPGDTAKMTLITTTYQGIDAGLYSAPHLYDLDTDADLDLLVGNHRGFVQYYRNTGTATSATFTQVTDTLGKIKLNDASGFPFTNGFSRPFIAQLDGDPQPELMVGGYTGTVQVFDNATDSPGAKFASLGLLGDSVDVGIYAAPLAGYPDALGQLRFLIGGYRGGLMLAEGGKPIGVETPASTLDFELWPNPAGQSVWINLPAEGEVAIFDPQGRALLSAKVSAGEQLLDLAALPAGVYLVKAFTDRAQGVKRLVVIR